MNRDELVVLAKKLYNDGNGISYGKIADKFNADGVSTISGKGSWEKKMVQRLIAADALKKTEVRVGMKTDREVRLESEAESLKAKLHTIETYRDELFSANNRLESENEYLKSENAGLKSDRDEAMKELNTVKQEYAVIAKSNDAFRSEIDRLNREMNTVEMRFKAEYEPKLTDAMNRLSVANQMVHELQDKQVFIKPESESDIPKNFMGWTIGKRTDGRGYNIYRKVAGKLHGLYIGKEWNADYARNKIAAFEAKQKPQSDLFAGSECKTCQHQVPFESRLRSVCPETIRTYRLDTVAGHFTDCDFGREIIGLAESKRIELLAGDPSQCDVSKLIQYRGRMYVNFEWL